MALRKCVLFTSWPTSRNHATSLGFEWLIKKDSKSKSLLDENVVYELQTHRVRPESVTKYNENYDKSVHLINSRKDELPCDHLGSWTVQVGDVDQAVHLWRHSKGFTGVDRYNAFLSTEVLYQALLEERRQYLRYQSLQYLIAFSYWPEIQPRTGHNLYELRSYSLKPGSIIEWGLNWKEAIKHKNSNNEAFAGFFAQVGQLFYVHHIWCYSSLREREQLRQSSFESHDWSHRVGYIMPLIRKLKAQIMAPTPFSPTQ